MYGYFGPKNACQVHQEAWGNEPCARAHFQKSSRPRSPRSKSVLRSGPRCRDARAVARAPRGRGLKLVAPLGRARAGSRVRLRAGFWDSFFLRPVPYSRPGKLLKSKISTSWPKSMPGLVQTDEIWSNCGRSWLGKRRNRLMPWRRYFKVHTLKVVLFKSTTFSHQLFPAI